MAFRVGQKVVCVDDSGWESWRASWLLPVTGTTYTIRSIGHAYTNETQEPCIRLEELRNREAQVPGQEPNFRASRFRPLVERKTETGMAILREILDRESHQNRAPAKATSGRVTDAAVQHGTEEA